MPQEEYFPSSESTNDTESEPGTSKEDSNKDSDSLLYIAEDFPDIGDNSEKLTDDFGEMSQAGVKTSVRTNTEMMSSGISATKGLKVGSSIGIMDQASENSSVSDTEETEPPAYTDMEAVD